MRSYRSSVRVGLGLVLGALAIRVEGAPVPPGIAEDEPEEHVETSDGKEGEGRDERELVDVVREHGRPDQDLENAQGTQTELGSKHWEVALEEGLGGVELGEDEYDDLD